MTRRAIMRFALGSAAAVALASPTGSAFADDANAKHAIRIDLLQETPSASADQPSKEIDWLGPNFRLHKKSGFAYTRHLKVSERPFVFDIQGPVLRKQEALGLAFKIRF